MIRRLPWFLAGLLLGVLLALLWPAGAIPPRPQPPLPTGLGFAAGYNCCASAELEQLHGAWWTDYKPAPGTDCLSPQPGAVSVSGALRVSMGWWWQSAACLGAIATTEPRGTLWILGNEDNLGPACLPSTCVANERAQVAAIRAGDPTARFASGGIANADPAWAAALLAAGGGDLYSFWTLHWYDISASGYYAAIARFRAWQAGRGDTRGILIGEWGVPPSWGDAQAASYFQATRTLPPGVQAAAWYGARDAHWGGSLLTVGGTLTATGRAFVGGPLRYWRRLAPR